MFTLRGRFVWQALTLSALLCAAVIHLSAKKKDSDATKSSATPLIAAASNCKLDDVNTLLKQGADFKARDGAGRDALTFASLQRNKLLDLQCPDVVLALTKAGADPWATRFYQSPDLSLHPLREIAVLRVEDIRDPKNSKPAKLKDMSEGVEQALSQRRLRVSNKGYAAGGIPVLVEPASYPIVTLSETQQKINAAGWSEADVMHPDRKRACSLLGTDAVFEVVLKEYAHKDIVIDTASAASLEFWLTDCRTGELVWKNDPGPLSEDRGFIVRGFIGGSFRILAEMGLSLPKYQGPKK